MTSDDITPSASPRGGFVGGPQMKAYDDIEAAKRAVDAALPITVSKPLPEAREAGVVVHFRHDGGDYEMVGDVSRGDVGLVVTRVELQASPPAGVTTRLLRTAPLAEVLNSVRAHEEFEEARRRGTRAILGEEPAPGLFTPPAPEIPETSGRTAITDDLLRSVAMAYMQETAPGKDRRAIQRMAVRFERPEGTVRTWISRARKEGWLGPGAKGRMGGEAGPKLNAWWGEALRAASDVSKEASRIALEYGAETYGVPQEATRLYNEPAELELSHRIGTPHLETNVIAQILYGHSLSAELGQRTRQAGASEDSAFKEVAQEVRATLANKGQDVMSGRDEG